jgi:hypothetical protein
MAALLRGSVVGVRAWLFTFWLARIGDMVLFSTEIKAHTGRTQIVKLLLGATEMTLSRDEATGIMAGK